MSKWICVICGYIYDPTKGIPDSGIAAGTSFEDIPEDWICPECGSPKASFEPYAE
jgi:rubredoxin